MSRDGWVRALFLDIILCALGFHSWKRLPDIEKKFGGELKLMERWTCRNCTFSASQVKGQPRTLSFYAEDEPHQP